MVDPAASQFDIDSSPEPGRLTQRLPLIASHVGTVAAIRLMGMDGPVVQTMVILAALGALGSAVIGRKMSLWIPVAYGFMLPFMGVFGAALIGGQLGDIGTPEIGIMSALGLPSAVASFATAWGTVRVLDGEVQPSQLSLDALIKSTKGWEKLYGFLGFVVAFVLLVLKLMPA